MLSFKRRRERSRGEMGNARSNNLSKADLHSSHLPTVLMMKADTIHTAPIDTHVPTSPIRLSVWVVGSQTGCSILLLRPSINN